MNMLFATCTFYPFFAGEEGYRTEALAQSATLLEEGYNCVIVMPFSKTIPSTVRVRMKKYAELSFMYGWRACSCVVYRLRRQGVTYYFLENEYYFGENKDGRCFSEGEKCAFFAYALLSSIGNVFPCPDMIFADGWRGCPLFLAISSLPQYRNLRQIKRYLLIDDFRKQGIFPISTRGEIFSLGPDADCAIYNTSFNLLRGGIAVADRIVIFSSYRKELWSDNRLSHGLAAPLAAVKDRILLFNERCGDGACLKSADLLFPYTPCGVVEGKRQNKALYLKGWEHTQEENVPLLAVAEELTEEKGEFLLRNLPQMLEERVHIVVCGMSSGKHALRLLSLSEKNRGRLHLLFTPQSKERHQLLAAADLALSLPDGGYRAAGPMPFVFGTPLLRDSGGGNFEMNDGAPEFLFHGDEDFLSVYRHALSLYSVRGAYRQLFRRAIRYREMTWEHILCMILDAREEQTGG